VHIESPRAGGGLKVLGVEPNSVRGEEHDPLRLHGGLGQGFCQ
jgi:hypothetical protein